MTKIDAAFTDEDYATLIGVLDEWTESESSEPSAWRNERAILLKAKLLFHQYEARIQHTFQEAVQPDAAQPSKLELAEQFIRECGIWSHFETFVNEQAPHVR